jgi:hypothetical protein
MKAILITALACAAEAASLRAAMEKTNDEPTELA